jgi:regulator of sirC expression with transglutaminase-like and TPR domain
MMDCNSVFARIISTCEEQLDVAHAALLFACEAYPNLDIASYLGALDDMAETLRPRLAHEHPVMALRSFLSGELGFQGNADDYFDPRNSYLNQVMDRRTGIPISLSAIYLEVARRLNLPIVGIALPGHFIIRYDGDEEPLYLDPFNGGEKMSIQDCHQRVADISNGRLPFRQSFLCPVGPRQILTRMLRNLKHIYVARTDFESVIPVVEKLILLDPLAAEELRDLGMLYYYTGQKLKAVGCLERYLSLAPAAADREAVKLNLGTIVGKVARWN